ncbi:unannotated protein [freshwater metagenome]|uniref:Unannotated protein n=1 Tax=freshwater metagenome TaxID=449393 RepID=A0A6J7DI21_9ZZZZ
MRSRRPGKSGAVQSEPFEACGFAPSNMMNCVRSRSGTGTVTEPNMMLEVISFGRWSTVEAEKRLREPRPWMRFRLNIIGARLCAPGLPR